MIPTSNTGKKKNRHQKSISNILLDKNTPPATSWISAQCLTLTEWDSALWLDTYLLAEPWSCSANEQSRALENGPDLPYPWRVATACLCQASWLLPCRRQGEARPQDGSGQGSRPSEMESIPLKWHVDRLGRPRGRVQSLRPGVRDDIWYPAERAKSIAKVWTRQAVRAVASNQEWSAYVLPYCGRQLSFLLHVRVELCSSPFVC